MQKFTEDFNRRVETDTLLEARPAARLKRWLDQAEAFGASHRAMATLVGVAWASTMGLINLNLAHSIRFDFFYLLGCAAVGWVAGTRGALTVTVVSGLFLYLAEVPQQTNGGQWILQINSLVRLVAFGLISWVAAKVGADARDLERTVALRTERLQREVEEHKETSEMVREAGQLFQQLTENITDVFWVTDPLKREVEYISSAFERVWGKSCESLRRAPSVWIEGIHHEDRERVTRAMLNKQIVGEYDEEYRVVRADGAVRWVHDRAFPVKDETGADYRLVGIAEDVGQPVLRVQGRMTYGDRTVFTFEGRRSGTSAGSRMGGGYMKDEDIQIEDIRSLTLDLTDFIAAIAGKYQAK